MGRVSEPLIHSVRSSRAGKKRAWVPDEKEAYIEIEIRERSGDKVVVETKDGKVTKKGTNIKTSEKKKKVPSDFTHIRPGLLLLLLLRRL